jgi:DNA-binding transcriptional LysR family regulator
MHAMRAMRRPERILRQFADVCGGADRVPPLLRKIAERLPTIGVSQDRVQTALGQYRAVHNGGLDLAGWQAASLFAHSYLASIDDYKRESPLIALLVDHVNQEHGEGAWGRVDRPLSHYAKFFEGDELIEGHIAFIEARLQGGVALLDAGCGMALAAEQAKHLFRNHPNLRFDTSSLGPIEPERSDTHYEGDYRTVTFHQKI